MKEVNLSNEKPKQEKNEKSVENELKQANIDLRETKDNGNISSEREIKEKFSIRRESLKIKNRKYLMIIPIVIVAIIVISLVVFFLIRLKNNKNMNPKKKLNLEKSNEGNYLLQFTNLSLAKK